ncbi:hypothetical protein ACEZ3G_12965 [Maribacter algicola]|uniref:Uncharacterized protein n=1 Tax=Meishania litoralis TaxID=3434685 RepID=A0ACC7LMF0_9FLAO
MKTKRTRLLRILDVLAMLLVIATFSPMVIPQNESGPYVLGIPYTMWMGFLVSVLFVVLAYLVSMVNKEDRHAD